MGLSSCFVFGPPPGLNQTNGGLRALFDSDALNPNHLLALGPVFLERLNLCGECPRQLVERPLGIVLPPYSPDFNPIEMAFAKLKALLRKAAERTVDALWDVIGKLVDCFTPQECANYFAACGYDAD